MHLLEEATRIGGPSGVICRVLEGFSNRVRQLMHMHNILYNERCASLFGECTHFSMTADPASYSGQHTHVAVIFSWQAKLAGVANIKAR